MLTPFWGILASSIILPAPFLSILASSTSADPVWKRFVLSHDCADPFKELPTPSPVDGGLRAKV